MSSELQQGIDRLGLVSWQRWTLIATAVLTATAASTICAVEAGHQTGVVVVLVTMLALAGCLVLLLTRPREPATASLLVVLGYLWAFGALYHLTRDGRMNLPFRTLLAIPASVALSFMLTRLARLLTRRRSSAA